MKVGDRVRLAHFHGSCTDEARGAEKCVGIVKSIEIDPDPMIITRCIEVLWDDGVSWHFPQRLIMENEE